MADETSTATTDATAQAATPTIESQIADVQAQKTTIEGRLTAPESKVAAIGDYPSIDDRIQAITSLLDKYGIRAE